MYSVTCTYVLFNYNLLYYRLIQHKMYRLQYGWKHCIYFFFKLNIYLIPLYMKQMSLVQTPLIKQ